MAALGLLAVRGRAGQGELAAQRERHPYGCWRAHPECALALARDLEATRREHHAARAARFGEALRRARHLDPVARLEQLGGLVAQARALLEAEHVPKPSGRPRKDAEGGAA